MLHFTGAPVHPIVLHLCHRLPLLAFLLALLAGLVGEDKLLFILGLKHDLYLVVLRDTVQFFVHVLVLAAPISRAWLLVCLVMHGLILHLLDGLLAQLDELLAMPGGQVAPHVVLRGLVPRSVLIA